MKRTVILIILTAVLVLTSCSGQSSVPAVETTEDVPVIETESYTVISGSTETEDIKESAPVTETIEMKELTLEIDGVKIPVTWEDNESVEALKELCKPETLVIGMSMYGGFEQVGPIGYELPHDDEQITTESGDIILYSGDQIVLFYGSNSWSYTRLGKMELSEDELAEILGNEDVSISLSIS